MRRISEGRVDIGVPVLSKIPYLGPRPFRQVDIGRQTEYLWISRDGATIAGRTRAANPQPAANINEESPRPGAVCHVVVAAGDKTSEHGGQLVGMTDEQIVLDQQRRIYTKRAVPHLGELPLVGAAFREVKGTDEHVRDEIARETVLCIRVADAAGTDGPVEAAPDQQNVFSAATISGQPR